MTLSKCCKAPVEVRGGDEGTNHYQCTKCGWACDVGEFQGKEEE